MSATTELIRAFEAAGRTGLTRDEIAVIVGRRNVTSRIRRLEVEHGYIFNKRPSKYDSRRTWRWVVVRAPGELADDARFQRDADAEPELTLFDDAGQAPAPGSALMGATA
jgi:hypothetical protein